MDAFENVVATILQHGGYWVRSSFKVDVTKAEKVQYSDALRSLAQNSISLPTKSGNVVRVVECKSYPRFGWGLDFRVQ